MYFPLLKNFPTFNVALAIKATLSVKNTSLYRYLYTSMYEVVSLKYMNLYIFINLNLYMYIISR